MKRIVLLSGLLIAGSAHAGTLAVTPGSGANLGMGSDGTNQIPATILCGASASATLYAVCVNQAIVNASGQLLTLAGQSGTWNLNNISGTISLPTGAATSALQSTGNSSLATLAATTSAYGTAPAGIVIGVNAFVTNTNANGQTTMSASSPVAIASDQSAVATKAASGAFVAGSIADLAHGQGTMSASVPVAIASNQSAIPTTATLSAQYPSGSTAVQGSATGTTAATSTTLAATVSVTNYVCSISIRANATAAATGNATLSDGTKTFNFTQWTAPNASGVGIVEETFSPCYPAAAANTAWTLTSAAPGTGGVVSVAIAGYQK
jgi:hypothetical protein